MNSFYTLDKSSTWEQVINKSRFIGAIYPVMTVEDIEKTLARVRELYPNARHYVYAYRLYDGHLEKASDDGEPQGTGGRPVLEAIQYRHGWNVLLVVIRYFGGILLGTGGLTRAYGGTARRLLEETELKLLSPYEIYKLTVPYNWYEQLKYHFNINNWGIGQEDFHEVITFEAYIPLNTTDAFENWLDELTGRQVIRSKEGIVWR